METRNTTVDIIKSEVAIDNDFVMHLSEIDWEQEYLEKTIKTFFEELKITPVMHELVYDFELVSGAETEYKTISLVFFNHGLMKKKLFAEYLTTPIKEKYYEMILKEIYRDFKGEFPPSIKDVFKDWKSHASLGETHSVTMCFMTQMDIFLSDDNDSKKLKNILETKKQFTLNVYNREAACTRLKEMGTTLNKDLRKVIKHKH